MPISASFCKESGVVQHRVSIDGSHILATVPANGSGQQEVSTEFLRGALAHPVKYHASERQRRVTYVDLFCGGGGLSLGIEQGLRFLGYSPRMIAAVDKDSVALSLVKRRFDPLVPRACSVDDLYSAQLTFREGHEGFVTGPTISDAELAPFAGKVDLVVGGPPCQGHSNLNNHTRRRDQRNLLYFSMISCAIALRPRLIIIENVPSILSSSENVVEVGKALLRNSEFHVSDFVLNAAHYGVAQRRQRHFLVASKAELPGLEQELNALALPQVSVNDVIGDLPDLSYDEDLLESNPNLSAQNVERIRYLFENGEYELPNDRRPECHQKDHTYPAVYGRLKGDIPSPTITTGFTSPGRGRFIHPSERRTINAREAARIQSFPDWYWEGIGELGFRRANLAKVIGDAVPPRLAMNVILACASAL
ncbi:DNA cytosine methyltransferase [Wenzhouxiangella sp. XN79A]|uniref:DNA cytosine methyltransferase n=1 Tax=Wenzhouxiangella sp. XN79A TaxID=2724193 RepID=UPI00144A9F00|nr:DNA cytosine methyltransferase [Wenzhouxiangella sp. XN79A]NKI35117.1 DNA cytosine methyltransferase [Wenzhouxiangella sp. XN79A]